jgi:hypothetical protein
LHVLINHSGMSISDSDNRSFLDHFKLSIVSYELRATEFVTNDALSNQI